MSRETSIVTHTGRAFDFLDPKPEQICLLDIAHSLALTNRYRGHTTRPYSVAEHCILASMLEGVTDPLACLLHDAAEAYIGDQSSPQKKRMFFNVSLEGCFVALDFKHEESLILRVIGEALGVKDLDVRASAESVRSADRVMFLTEVRDLMPSHEFFDGWYSGLTPCDSLLLSPPHNWEDVKGMFIDRFWQLKGNE